MTEARIKMLFEGVFQTEHGDEGVFGAGITNNAADFFLDNWQNAHEPIVTYSWVKHSAVLV
jgi:hypothetical protein